MFRLTGTKKFRRYFTPFQFPIFRYHFFPSFKYISPIKIKNFNQRRFTNLPPTQSLFDPISYASCFIFSLLFYKLCSVSGPSVGSGIHYRYLALLDPCVRREGEGEGEIQKRISDKWRMYRLLFERSPFLTIYRRRNVYTRV